VHVLTENQDAPGVVLRRISIVIPGDIIINVHVAEMGYVVFTPNLDELNPEITHWFIIINIREKLAGYFPFLFKVGMVIYH
jgi:hypothetical protein